MAKRQFATIFGAAALVALLPVAASADEFIGGWQRKVPVVKYGVIPVETQAIR